MNTAEKIRLPDDCTIGYIIESVLGVPLTRSNLFHSHLENLQQVSRTEIHKQVRNCGKSALITDWNHIRIHEMPRCTARVYGSKFSFRSHSVMGCLKTRVTSSI